MKILILALTLIPTMALANLDDSVFNGSSSEVKSREFKDDFSDRIGSSVIRDDLRILASDSSHSKKFEFPVDGYDAGTSVSN